MRLLIASDIHGSATQTAALAERIKELRPDTLLLLGDILYHGPRNTLPEGYAPAEV
ncbi:MAG: metallophosphoesterase, partial [Candidatus Adiutrix sp.]|nr:metallophosphoesterase [Candidatus Adiutrix sp.]